jgi:oxygen-independent coproporphyrinogen-3 oxidase
MFSIYVHVPFCSVKCPYCDFNTYAVTKVPEKKFVEAIIKELVLVAPEWEGEVSSIYFGGGTPSLLSPIGIGRILDTIGNLFSVSMGVEITLEANPGNISEEKADGLKMVGINRLSLGAQSFSEAVLRALGRRHKPEQIVEAIRNARQAGITNISLDLIYGVLPNEEIFIEESVNHISLYSLTIEEGTPFFRDFKDGKLVLPSEEEIEGTLRSLHALLVSKGFHRYEVSNYAKKNFESRHNKNYWFGGSYLGVGPGAHSCKYDWNNLTGIRHSNKAKPEEYKDSLEKAESPVAWREKLDLKKLKAEFFMLRLRTERGIDLDVYKQIFGTDLEVEYRANLAVFQETGLINFDGRTLTLSDAGFMLADSVIEEFLP